MFSKIDHRVAYRICLSKGKGIEIVRCVLSDHSEMKLEINGKRNWKKSINTHKLNNTYLNNQGITDEIKEKIKQYLQLNDNASTTCWTPVGHNAISPLRSSRRTQDIREPLLWHLILSDPWSSDQEKVIIGVPKEGHQEKRFSECSQKATWSSTGCDSSRWLTRTEELRGAVHGSKIIPEET